MGYFTCRALGTIKANKLERDRERLPEKGSVAAKFYLLPMPSPHHWDTKLATNSFHLDSSPKCPGKQRGPVISPWCFAVSQEDSWLLVNLCFSTAIAVYCRSDLMSHLEGWAWLSGWWKWLMKFADEISGWPMWKPHLLGTKAREHEKLVWVLE